MSSDRISVNVSIVVRDDLLHISLQPKKTHVFIFTCYQEYQEQKKNNREMFYQICLFHLSKVLYFPLPSTFPFQLYCYFFTYKSIYSLEGQFSNLKEVLTSSLTLHVVTFKLANFITFCLYSRVYELLSVLKQQPFHCHVIMFDY